MTKKAIIGVDIGGTKIMTGVITPDGEVVGKPYTIPTGGNDEQELIIGRVIDSINIALKNSGLNLSEIEGIGMGVTGPLDIENGVILECPQLPTLHFFPLRKRIYDEFKIPVLMNNDANCLILGETVWGAGKGFNSVLGFTLGTGIGCAVVMSNKLLEGATGTAGEIWTSPYKWETIEDYVSGRGISSIYKKLSGKEKTAKQIADLAFNYDANALQTWDEFGRAFGYAIAWSINLLDPDIVVVGGSIANSFDLFETPMNNFLRKHICPVPGEKTKIVTAKLGDYAGFMGGAALISQNH